MVGNSEVVRSCGLRAEGMDLADGCPAPLWGLAIPSGVLPLGCLLVVCGVCLGSSLSRREPSPAGRAPPPQQQHHHRYGHRDPSPG